MKIAFSPASALGQLLMLRSVAIVIQIVMVAIAILVFDKQFDFLAVAAVVAAESVFQLLSIYAYRNIKEAAPLGMTMQLLADIVFLTVLLALTGGATNAFVSLLVLPTIIAAVTLPSLYMLFVCISAIAAYGYLYLRMSNEHMHHMDMSTHLLGMLVNFTFTIIVVATVVTILVQQNRRKARDIAALREQQLQQEQVIALGSAAAQATHQLATPIAHLALLHEELSDNYPKDEAVQEMAQPIASCQQQLHEFRRVTEYVKANKTHSVAITKVLSSLQQLATLQYPQQHFTFTAEHCSGGVVDDPMLIPALLNLIANAVRANEANNQQSIVVTCEQSDGNIAINITDNGIGVEPLQLAKLGQQIVDSENGLGMAVLLSHATIERLGGRLIIKNQSPHGTSCVVTLPRIHHETTAH
ncbi:sensor histidine kinase [Pseudoalteromonas 'SMAR']|uniref:sensor histidine kinase n=1 Tax=Pseudoalteromonas 'SMAR' TaxID=3416908 RepID=UPI003AF27954